MLTRKGARDVVDIELAFSALDTLPRGQLPTKSDVIERTLLPKQTGALGKQLLM